MRAHCRHLANTIKHVLPSATRVHNPNVKLIGSAVFAQLTAESPYTLQWAPLSPKFLVGSRPHLIYGSLGQSEPTTLTMFYIASCPDLKHWSQHSSTYAQSNRPLLPTDVNAVIKQNFVHRMIFRDIY